MTRDYSRRYGDIFNCDGSGYVYPISYIDKDGLLKILYVYEPCELIPQKFISFARVFIIGCLEYGLIKAHQINGLFYISILQLKELFITACDNFNELITIIQKYESAGKVMTRAEFMTLLVMLLLPFGKTNIVIYALSNKATLFDKEHNILKCMYCKFGQRRLGVGLYDDGDGLISRLKVSTRRYDINVVSYPKWTLDHRDFNHELYSMNYHHLINDCDHGHVRCLDERATEGDLIQAMIIDITHCIIRNLFLMRDRRQEGRNLYKRIEYVMLYPISRLIEKIYSTSYFLASVSLIHSFQKGHITYKELSNFDLLDMEFLKRVDLIYSSDDEKDAKDVYNRILTYCLTDGCKCVYCVNNFV